MDERLTYALQRHTGKGREHLDLRLGSPSPGMRSWAIPRGRMPEAGEKLLAVQTPVHDFKYSTTFSGTLRGGDRVALEERGPARTDENDRRLVFTVGEKGSERTYTLVRTRGQGGKWLIQRIEPDLVEARLVKDAKNVPIRLEVADTPEKRRVGLSKRSEISDNSCMFFTKPGIFWMKDVNFPLDLAFLDKQGCVIQLQRMHVQCVPDEKLTRYAPEHEKTAYALELPVDLTDRHGITEGWRVSI